MNTDDYLGQCVDEPHCNSQYKQFILCGSRKFEQADWVIKTDSCTDYDYIAPYCNENRGILKSIGFIVRINKSDHTNQDYMDNTAVELWTNYGSVNRIQIILREDNDTWAKMLDNIDPTFYYNYLWKSGPNKPTCTTIRDIFNQLYRSTLASQSTYKD